MQMRRLRDIEYQTGQVPLPGSFLKVHHGSQVARRF